LDEQTRL